MPYRRGGVQGHLGWRAERERRPGQRNGAAHSACNVLSLHGLSGNTKKPAKAPKEQRGSDDEGSAAKPFGL